MLYGSYMHYKDQAQYALLDWCVFNRYTFFFSILHLNVSCLSICPSCSNYLALHFHTSFDDVNASHSREHLLPFRSHLNPPSLFFSPPPQFVKVKNHLKPDLDTMQRTVCKLNRQVLQNAANTEGKLQCHRMNNLLRILW